MRLDDAFSDAYTAQIGSKSFAHTSAGHMEAGGHAVCFSVSLCESETLRQVFSTPDSDSLLSLYFSTAQSLSAGLQNINS